MPHTATSTRSADVPSFALVGFFAMTFAITWGVVSLYILAPDWASARFGEISGSHPFFFLATWAPAISAFALVLYFGGLAGLKAFLSRLFLVRLAAPWILFILIAIPVVYILGSLLKSGPVLAPLPPGGIAGMFAWTFMMLCLGPIEEFGWRGVAQPILQRHMAPLWAGIIIGTVWGIWHLPAFFLSGTVFAAWSFFPFLVGNITLAVLVTPIFNSARGSLVWPMLFHWQLIFPIWPDAQPYDTWLFLAVAVAVVWWNRKTMLRRDGSAVEVIPSDDGMAR
ncbi:type II CAAX endopeptidase family protein [uncultured Mameliella sp.]|uniref:CPBP family intramembrane glutamic endopeptidase n=1 Tax=uncultured Mameliella sp. TaxID=1447087 RepID=UPI00261B9246|nr:type II CAAX endopeptidase family protein [uncultured Mameliella sp.]